MKLKKFKQLFEREEFDDIDGVYNSEYEYSDDFPDDFTDEDSDSDDDMSHLCSLLRQMFSNSNISVYIESTGLDLSITAECNRKESLNDVIKVFEIIKRIKKDVLLQYDSGFEMWETKAGYPMITFDFLLDKDKDGDGIYTDDEDDL